ncbi:hypothetical protein Cgig2_006937 [Carnegiea gigantea]|uniref:Protein BIG GRAIN 1-like A n=1 Tax=Carnegiea gigantea TaxID=171969 RepID=A0A9Q1KE04_9CARY|nr:hypothetical protein Cgig2_006937 [Carnegiea gigantea]
MSTTSEKLKYSIRDHHHHHQCNYPSFSSTLLEEVYRSFDDEERDHNHRTDRIMTSATMKKSSSCYMDRDRDDYHRLRANRFFAVDRWIENEKINLRRKSTPPAVHSDAKFERCDDRRTINHSSSTSSSDSSSGIGGFSSSDTESLYGPSAKSKKKLPAALLKPIRTTQNPPENHRKSYSDEILAKKKKGKEGNLQRRALKLYSDLKKVKQPISPGGKLASFLNSLFHSNASKKPHISSSPAPSKLETESPATTSRSCLSKTPSSAGRFERRSVRFVDDDCKGNERKCNVAKHDSSILAGDEEFKLQIKEKHRRVEEVAKELLKNYHHHNRKELTHLPSFSD